MGQFRTILELHRIVQQFLGMKRSAACVCWTPKSAPTEVKHRHFGHTVEVIMLTCEGIENHANLTNTTQLPQCILVLYVGVMQNMYQ